MTCPWCGFLAGPRALHAHLSAEHGDAVRTIERNGRVFYEVVCPRCDARYEHLVRKGARDRGFVTEFGQQISMVALDMLVHHLMAEHEQPEPEQPEHEQPEHEHQQTGE
ncbi:MAG TPA: hypothetical protein VNF47_27375 [Streptosporangiaceae bacterium]|nr:hypothetical protein [Streptosporangiaceae bacterium]